MRRLLFSIYIFAAVIGFAETDQFEFSFGPRFFGASLAARYALAPPTAEGTEQSITARLSGAWESAGYYRIPDGSLYTADAGGYSSIDASYTRVDLLWELGFQQGLLPGKQDTRDGLIAFATYRGQYDQPTSPEGTLFGDSGIQEIEGILRGSLVSGLGFSNVRNQPATGIQSGTQIEVATEYAPPFLHNQILGSSEYFRASLTAKGFLPLFVLPPDGEFNVFGAYLAMMGTFDVITGPEIPLEIRSTTGGRSIRSGTGGLVRGYESGRFDATVKGVGNIEARLRLPSIVWPALVPGAVVFTDVGYYLDKGDLSPVAEQNSGLLASSGAGLSIDVFGVLDLVLYTTYLWSDETIEAKGWVPFSVGFGYHF